MRHIANGMLILSLHSVSQNTQKVTFGALVSWIFGAAEFCMWDSGKINYSVRIVTWTNMSPSATVWLLTVFNSLWTTKERGIRYIRLKVHKQYVLGDTHCWFQSANGIYWQDIKWNITRVNPLRMGTKSTCQPTVLPRPLHMNISLPFKQHLCN